MDGFVLELSGRFNRENPQFGRNNLNLLHFGCNAKPSNTVGMAFQPLITFIFAPPHNTDKIESKFDRCTVFDFYLLLRQNRVRILRKP